MKKKRIGVYQYVYNHTDHLGNIRISYTKVDGVTKVLEENNYYAFGLKHQNYNSPVKKLTRKISDDTKSAVSAVENPFKYKYNGKELQDELGLDWYDYGARNGDPAVIPFTTIDPRAEEYYSQSPYVFAANNPVYYVDINGEGVDSTIVVDNEDGTYTVTGGDPNDGDKGVYIDNGDGGKGEQVGESLTTHSFFDGNNNAVVGAVIDTNSTEGQDFLDNEIVGDNPNVFYYKDNAKLNQKFDFKSRDLDKKASSAEALKHRARGSMTTDGKMASARDFGNVGAGIVATRAGVPQWLAKKKFNKLQGGAEPPVSAKAQQIGLDIGTGLRLDEIIKKNSAPPTGSKF